MPIVVVVPYIQPQCIVQNGIKYCEQTNFTKHDIGGVCIFILLLLLWGFIISELSYDHPIWAGFIFSLPFILGSLLFFLT